MSIVLFLINNICTFFSNSCCQRGLHVIGQQGCGDVVYPICYHHGHKMARGADGVERRGRSAEMFVSGDGGDPKQQTRCFL